MVAAMSEPAKTAPNTETTLYVALVTLAGIALVVVRAPALRFDNGLLFAVLVFGSIVLSTWKVPLPLIPGGATLSMSYFTDFVALLLLGPDEGMLVAAASGGAQSLLLSKGRPHLTRALFNASVLMIAAQLAWHASSPLGGFFSDSKLELLQATVAAAAVFFFVNTVLVAVAVALSRREPIVKTWYDHFFLTAPACFIAAGSAVLLVHAASVYVWAALVAAGPLHVTLRAYRLYLGRLAEQQRHLEEVSALHLASVEALARAIDARDQTIDHERSGENHIRRVQGWAVALAEAAGMKGGDVEAVKIAALLHDIGKLAVPEHILTKPGRLTAKEFGRVRIHPIVGAEIIKAVPFPYPVAPIIRSHHERWDGAGYPDGLQGEETPLGARVLSVVDYFDALTSVRPYHAAADRDVAVATLQSEAARALDPSLVALFLSILPTLDAEQWKSRQAEQQLPTSLSGGVPLNGLADGMQTMGPAWVFNNISLATQEMRALYDVAQTLGTRLSVDDTMALLTSKLSRLVPGSCWVLYLHDQREDMLRCRYASGLHADVVRRLNIPNGGGATGWAARNRMAVVNARAGADFEAAKCQDCGRLFQSALVHPFLDGEELVGLLTIYHEGRDPFREDHRHVLDHISGQAASVLHNAIAFERMRATAVTDPLTDLPNSRALADFFAKLIANPAGESASNALIMIDLDDFKAVNDGHGHQTGDAALTAVATAIRSHIRGTDFCARYGGDEFVTVLAGCDRNEAEHRARRLQYAVSRIQLPGEGGRVLSLGISVGVSVFPEDGTTIETLIASADRQMYVDKARRRGFTGELPALPRGA
jgi:diguanylate cyclase (GGDEF)-like protein/putative nucleotidyltransferase with HDIG domain